MNKNFLIFLLLVLALVVAKTAYNKHCKSKPEGCKEEKIDYEKDGLPIEGIDWQIEETPPSNLKTQFTATSTSVPSQIPCFVQ